MCFNEQNFLILQLEQANNIEFVRFWDNLYHATNADMVYQANSQTCQLLQETINYLEQLNLGSPLNNDNIIQLMRWKYTRYTHCQNHQNETVNNILQNIGTLNGFRNSENNEVDRNNFKNFTRNIFHSGTVMRVFLFHICRPWEYPIVDQHTARAIDFLTNNNANFEDNFRNGCLEQNWDLYQTYIKLFYDIAENCGFAPNHGNFDYVPNLKRVDNALFAFGKFIKRYPHLFEQG